MLSSNVGQHLAALITSLLLTKPKGKIQESQVPEKSPYRQGWAILLKRVFAIDVSQCPVRDGAEYSMLTPSDPQINQRDAARQANFLRDIAVGLRQQYPHILAKINDTSLMMDLKQAHASALQFGFTDEVSISHFLYFSIVYSKFFEYPGFVQWMRRPFDTPERRFRDFYHVTVFTLDMVMSLRANDYAAEKIFDTINEMIKRSGQLAFRVSPTSNGAPSVVALAEDEKRRRFLRLLDRPSRYEDTQPPVEIKLPPLALSQPQKDVRATDRTKTE